MATQQAQQYPKGITPFYAVEEPSTGLYAAISSDGARLAARRDASRFADRASAVVAVAGSDFRDLAHEIVRVDA
jgi:lipid-binding SYLF domain-containing protein